MRNFVDVETGLRSRFEALRALLVAEGEENQGISGEKQISSGESEEDYEEYESEQDWSSEDGQQLLAEETESENSDDSDSSIDFNFMIHFFSTKLQSSPTT